MEDQERKRLPVGVIEFPDIISLNGYYVDKTHLIGKLIDDVFPGGAMLFTRPRRFGKTLALNTLRSFFDCNEKEENRHLFDGLAVAQSERYMAEQGKYPVIYFDFKTVEGENQEKLEEDLRNALQDGLFPLEYLTQDDKLSPRERERMDRLLASQVSPNDICTSLAFVCSLLAKHHGQPAVILIDEYDAPLQAAYKYGFYQPVCTLMRKLFSSALKNNRNLRLGVITGVMRIAKESLFSGLNNLEVNTIISQDYADCFGFTTEEVTKMLAHYGYADRLGEVRTWYDGYRFGDIDIYNPWSILEYINHRGHADVYWLSTSGNDLAQELLKRLEKEQQDEVLGLFQGDSVTASVDTTVTYEQLKSQNPNILYSMLAISGYLKPIERISDDVYRLTIPNKEIKKVYSQEILSRLEPIIYSHEITCLAKAFIQGDEQQVGKLLNKYMLATLSYYDRPETFYHGWMMGLFTHLVDAYICKSNREAGYGRADAILTPLQGCSAPGIVFEFKSCDKPEQMPAEAEEALQQIEEKRYFAEFAPEVKMVLGYGVAFCKKECVIRQGKWMR